MKTSLITKNKKFPNFITSHKIFSDLSEIDKVFPKLGLNNSSKTIDVSLKNKVEHIFANLLKNKILEKFNKCSYKAAYFCNTIEETDAIKLLKNGKIILPQEIQSKFGSSHIDRIYGGFYYGNPVGYPVRHSCTDLLGFGNDLKLSKLSGATKVVFTSTGKIGAWDIATMSMRGFTSCQSWHGSYKRNLIGSIVDPYVGIIYLTDGTSGKYGTKMLARSLVRYVVNTRNKKPCLLLEKQYPYGLSLSQQWYVYSVFNTFLQIRTKGALPIVSGDIDVRWNYKIPTSTAVNKLKKYSVADDCHYDLIDYLSYRDSEIEYSSSKKAYFSSVRRKLTSL